MTHPLWCGSFSSDDGAGANDHHSRRHLRIVPDTEAPDAALVERLRAGDLDAFRTVFTAYYPVLHRFVSRWIGDDAAAEDIAQGVFADVWQRREALVLHASLKSYLFAAARHRVRDAIAHDIVVARHVRELQSDTAFAVTPATDESVLADELIRVAERRIATLPPRMQTIYRLSRDAGLSYAEIAAELGISVNTVYVQMGRALAALRDVLGDWER